MQHFDESMSRAISRVHKAQAGTEQPTLLPVVSVEGAKLAVAVGIGTLTVCPVFRPP